MEKISLIKVKTIKDYYTPINNNVDDRAMKVHILEAQDYQLRGVMGAIFYDDFMIKYKEYALSGTTLPTEYVYIKEKYIDMVLIYASIFNSMFDFDSKITNKGIEQQSSDFSTNKQNINYRKEQIQQQMDNYIKIFEDYLEDNYTQFPLYNRNEKEGTTYMGWYIPGKNKRC